MDVIGGPDREPRTVPPWWRPRALVPVALVAAAIAVGVPLLQGPDPAALTVVLAGSAGGTDGASADGALSLLLENAQDRPLSVGVVSLSARGVRSPDSEPLGELAAFEQRELRLPFEVPDCGALELPVRVRVTAVGDAEVRELVLPGTPGPDGFDPCARSELAGVPELGPPADGPPDLAIRATGGTTSPVGNGVRGTLELEVRNGGRPVRLAGLTAEVPGVRFAPRTPPNGATLRQDELIGLELGYVIEDCTRLVRAGRVVFTLLEPEGPLEVGLALLDDRGERRQSALDRVLDACPE